MRPVTPRGDPAARRPTSGRGPQIRPAILEAKAPRRVHVGGALTFLFENTDTIRYQVQEMVRAERMTREPDIRHELETYNELLGGQGELGAVAAHRDRRPGRARP